MSPPLKSVWSLKVGDCIVIPLYGTVRMIVLYHTVRDNEFVKYSSTLRDNTSHSSGLEPNYLMSRHQSKATDT